MVSEFGNRFNHLFRGPMWSSVSKDDMKDPLCVSNQVATLFKYGLMLLLLLLLLKINTHFTLYGQLFVYRPM